MIIEDILKNRAQHELRQTHLTIDYYRIRRRINVRLPVAEIPHFAYPIRGYEGYPWHIWLLWDLEERIYRLACGAAVTGDPRFRETAIRELTALAGWSSFDDRPFPHLAPAHAVRTLIGASRILSQPAVSADSVAADVKKACTALLDETAAWVDSEQEKLPTMEALLSAPPDTHALHNIHVIGVLALAMAATESGHPEAANLQEWSEAHVRAILSEYRDGSTEGVGYDGYILDFVADWLVSMPESVALPFRNEGSPEAATLSAMLEQSLHLSCPGAAEAVAELSDVEPREMPFHLSAHAKLGVAGIYPLSQWYLRRCDPQRLRTDGLYAWLRGGGARSAPVGGDPAGDGATTNYTVTLRSGWERDDLAVVASTSTSAMSHLHSDRGSIVIGKFGTWYIEDPGYQQYLKTSEREYAVGALAHNCPVIGGSPPQKQPTRIIARDCAEGDGVSHAALDLSACYPDVAESVCRTVFRAGADCIIVADQVRFRDNESDLSVSYAWHGAREASWGVEDGSACIYHNDHALYIRCSHADVEDGMIDRLPGSRGSMTLVVPLSGVTGSGTAIIWWSFLFEAETTSSTTTPSTTTTMRDAANADHATIGGRRFALPAEARQL